MSKFHIYTDGSARFNPGPGGWGTIVLTEDEMKLVLVESDTDNPTTNNRMELKAILCALQLAADYPEHYFIIHSDSAYAVNSCTQWMSGWARNGWRNSKKQTVENVDLMKALWEYLSRPFFNAEIRKCDGHAGVTGNELADAAATGNWERFENLLEAWDISTERNYDDMSLDEAIAWMKAEIELGKLEKSGDNWFPID